MNRMRIMLEAAIDGSFKEQYYDETKLSALENRMARYLLECSVTSIRHQQEKDRIKELISDISHQTKTPIANILLYAELLSEQNHSNEENVCIKALSEQADKLNFLIQTLVKLSRLETGIITVSPVKESIRELINTVIEQIKPKAEEKEITIVTDDVDDAFAMFDLKWTMEALYNIVDNAVKYTEKHKSITIKTQVYELFLRIDIIDEGFGIAKEEQNKIFSRFYRSPKVSQIEGIGIGLYLSREIITQEGGYIKVSSDGCHGSIFSVFLPLE